MTIQKELTDLFARVQDLPARIKLIEDQINAVDARMTALKDAGLIYASGHWKAGKYFQLVYPQKDGVRPSPTYIGTDEKKILAAQQGMERAKEYDELARVAQHLAGKVTDARYKLRELEAVLTLR